MAPFLIKISHRSLAIAFGYSLSHRGAVFRPFRSTIRVVWPTGKSQRVGSLRLIVCFGALCTGLLQTSAFKARGVGPRAGISMAAQRPTTGSAPKTLLVRGRLKTPGQMKAFVLDAVGLHLLGQYPYKNKDDLTSPQQPTPQQPTPRQRLRGT